MTNAEDTLVIPSDEEFAALAQACDQASESLEKQKVGLRAKFVSYEEFITGATVGHGIDFDFLDALVARTEAALAQKPDAVRMVHFVPCRVRDFLEMLQGSLAGAASYRGKPM